MGSHWDRITLGAESDGIRSPVRRGAARDFTFFDSGLVQEQLRIAVQQGLCGLSPHCNRERRGSSVHLQSRRDQSSSSSPHIGLSTPASGCSRAASRPAAQPAEAASHRRRGRVQAGSAAESRRTSAVRLDPPYRKLRPLPPPAAERWAPGWCGCAPLSRFHTFAIWGARPLNGSARSLSSAANLCAARPSRRCFRLCPELCAYRNLQSAAIRQQPRTQ